MGREHQRNSENKGLVVTEDKRNSGPRGPEEQWAQRTRGTVGIEDQRTRGPENLWVQRTRGTVGTEDQRTSGYKGPEEQWE